jgi:hypothetical protein
MTEIREIPGFAVGNALGAVFKKPVDLKKKCFSM